jgi:hypothetical protein
MLHNTPLSLLGDSSWSGDVFRLLTDVLVCGGPTTRFRSWMNKQITITRVDSHHFRARAFRCRAFSSPFLHHVYRSLHFYIHRTIKAAATPILLLRPRDSFFTAPPLSPSELGEGDRSLCTLRPVMAVILFFLIRTHPLVYLSTGRVSTSRQQTIFTRALSCIAFTSTSHRTIWKQSI